MGPCSRLRRGGSRRVRFAAVVLAVACAVGACADSNGDAGSDAATGPGSGATSGPTRAPSSDADPTASTEAVAATAGCGGDVGVVPDNRVLARTIDSAGGERAYLVYVPESYATDEPAPVAFTFHGAGSNKEQQLAYSAFGPLAEERGALVVSPDALGQPRRWSPYGGAVSEAAGIEGVNDLEFFVDLLDEIQASFCVDTARVWVTGMSSGGFMTATIACAYSDVIAAAAPVTATAYSDTACGDAAPVPYAYFHGTDDPVVPFLGPVPGPEGEPGPGSAEMSSQQWATHNGCDDEPQEERIGEDVVHRWWENCAARTDLYIVEGGGHTWPGAVDIPGLGPTTHDISATEIIWDLFEASARSGD
jgi:polyhydroxybutyrate depolymerase